MRARLLRPAAGVALLSAAVLSLSASAATKPLVLTDPKGDANGVGVGPGSQDGTVARPVEVRTSTPGATTVRPTFSPAALRSFSRTVSWILLPFTLAGTVSGLAPSAVRRLLVVPATGLLSNWSQNRLAFVAVVPVTR